jgi:hypothetical protein
MFFTKKAPQIEFFSLIPEIETIAPIINASKVRPLLMQNSAEALSVEKKCPNYGKQKSTNTSKCSGIIDYYKHGWILTAWQDITIKTNGDGESFEWMTPIDQSILTNGSVVGKYIDYHPKESYSNHVDDDPNTLKHILKINTSWRCKIPKGYYLFESDVPYSNEKRFNVASGFYDSDFGVGQMNVNIFWHLMNGETVIKAGTPIAHYMLIPKEKATLVVRSATDDDILKDSISKLETNRRFISSKSESKCLFAKLFK